MTMNIRKAGLQITGAAIVMICFIIALVVWIFF